MKNPADCDTTFGVGCRVLVGDKAKMPGTLRFLGTVHFVDGVWCGVELDEEEGLHDGQVQNVRYFNCPPRKGVFAPLSRVQPLYCSSLARSKTHGILFDCPFEKESFGHNRLSRLPRPAYSTAAKRNDNLEWDLKNGQRKCLEVECLLDVKNQEFRMRKAASPKKVTFDMEPEFMEDDLECRWRRSRSEDDSLLLYEAQINCIHDDIHNQNRLEDDLANRNYTIAGSTQEMNTPSKPPAAVRPKSVSASLDAVESDLNELLQKIDREISNVKTPDTAEISNFVPDFFPKKIKSNQNHQIKLDNNPNLFHCDEDYFDGMAEEGLNKLTGQQKVGADEGDADDIMLLTGSPTFRLAQTAMVQYAELLKASQAGLVVQKARFQLVNCAKVSDKELTDTVIEEQGSEESSLSKPERTHRDSSTSASSSNDDVYEVFDGEDLYNFKVTPDNETDLRDPDFESVDPPAPDTANLQDKPSGDQPELASDDVCNFLDSLLKSGQELEKWLEISVADLQSQEMSSDQKMCSELDKFSRNLLKSEVAGSPQNVDNFDFVENQVVRDDNANEHPFLERVESFPEDITKSRPLSYASTVDSFDTGCQMELDGDDITRSFNLGESLIDLGNASDSLLVESWNEIFRPDAVQQGIESIEKSVFEYFDVEERDCNAEGLFVSDTNELQSTRIDDIYDGDECNAKLIDFTSQETEGEQNFLKNKNDYKKGATAEIHLLQTHEAGENMNFIIHDVKSSSVQNFLDEMASDSQEANASGLSSTPGSSFSSCGSSQRDHDILLQDTLSESLEENSPLFLHIDRDLGQVLTAEVIEPTTSVHLDAHVTDDKDGEEEKTILIELVESNGSVCFDVVEKKGLADETLPVACDDDAVGLDSEMPKESSSGNLHEVTIETSLIKTSDISSDSKAAQTNGSSKKSDLRLKAVSGSQPNRLVVSKIGHLNLKTSKGNRIAPNKVTNEANMSATSDQTKDKIHLQTKGVSPTKSALPSKKSELARAMNGNVTESRNMDAVNRIGRKTSQSNSRSIDAVQPSTNQKSRISSTSSGGDKMAKPAENAHMKTSVSKLEPHKEVFKTANPRVGLINNAKEKQVGMEKKNASVASRSQRVSSRAAVGSRSREDDHREARQTELMENGNVGRNSSRLSNNVSNETAKIFHSSLPVKQNPEKTTGEKKQVHGNKVQTNSKAAKNAKNTMASGTGMKEQSTKTSRSETSTGEIRKLKNQLNEAMTLGEQYQKEIMGLEQLIANHEKQYKSRITKFERALEEKLAWLKSDLEIKHNSFVQELSEKHEQEMECLRTMSEVESKKLRTALEKAKEMYEVDVANITSERISAIEEINKKHKEEIDEVTRRYESSMKHLEKKIEAIQTKLEESEARERSLREASMRDREEKEQASLEVNSLKVVVEEKSKEVKKLRNQNSVLGEKALEVPLLQDKVTFMQRKIEQLESVIVHKRENEKVLLDEKQQLLKRSMEGSEAVRKLSMNNEELAWRLSQGDAGSPIHREQKFPFSPTSLAPNSPLSPSVAGSPMSWSFRK